MGFVVSPFDSLTFVILGFLVGFFSMTVISLYKYVLNKVSK
jgi:hypothetical protein